MRSMLFTHFKPLVLSIHFAAIAMGAGMATIAHAQITVNIAAGDLNRALSQFALQHNVNLILEGHALAAYQTAGLQGSYSIEDGFNQLLAQTPFQIQKVTNGYTLVAKTVAAKQQVRDMGQLKPIDVNASGQVNSRAGLNAVNQLPVIAVVAESKQHSLKKITQSGALGSKSILDTPFSVTVVESDDISKRGAKTLGQIFINDPAVYSQSAAMATDWWGTAVRGLGVSNYYIDGFPMSLHWGGDFPAEAAESVTVLKGLTGFMYGFGSPGGAISYQLKRPKATPETSLEVSYRNPAMVTALIDTSDYIDAVDLGYRFVIGGDKGEAYNTADQNHLITSLALDKKLTDNINWTANFIYENNKTEHEPPIFSFGSLTNGFPKVTYDYDHLTIDNSFYKTNTFNAFTGLDWKINENWALKYQLGYTRKEHHSNLVFDYLLNNAGDYRGNLYQFAGLDKSTLNQLMLMGHLNTGVIQHDLVAGIGYTVSTYQSGKDSYWGNVFNGNLYQDQSYIITRKPDYSFKPKSSETAQTYGYISDTIKFNEQWQTILGLRHTYYDSEALNSAVGYNTKATTPTVALLYKPLPEATLYASYVESLESGSVVGTTYANAGEVLDATVSKQYEVGVKYDAQPFGLTAALFKMERAATMDSIRNGLTYLTQDGLTNYTGLELNGNYKPIDTLKLGMGMMYLDASIDQVSEANKATKGHQPAGVAKWSGVANAEYTVDSVEGLSLHGNIRYNGESYTSTANIVEVPAYTLVNVGASYKFKLGGHDAIVNGNINNLLNKKYWASSGSWASIGEARNGVLALKVTW
ncbi:MAG: TonB-dependent receptor [Acinetobacter populi]|uniref:TonB-dependent siderophore receptor n=1 Tax=Acinetobacter populi TaxID=1582270 RepID=UPI0023527980|nr:TonB-dependent receptor [Acinetobacter populi]MCH4249233.1 TonB-dependent receptor [Acinetobacter populi]